jgi:hypothetical protein
VASAEETLDHVAAHLPQTNDRDLHRRILLKTERRGYAAALPCKTLSRFDA